MLDRACNQLLCGALATLIVGCAAPTGSGAGSQEAAAPDAITCDQSLTRAASFSDAAAPDTIMARSLAAPALSDMAKAQDLTMDGALCSNAILVYSIHSGANGGLLYTLAMPLAGMDLPNGPQGGWTPAAVQKLLEDTLAQTDIVTTERAPAFGDSVKGQTTTPLGQDAYEALRKRALPMLCHRASVHDLRCVYSDPQFSGIAEHIFTRDES